MIHSGPYGTLKVCMAMCYEAFPPGAIGAGTTFSTGSVLFR